MTSETEKKFSQVQETVKMAKEAKEIADKLKQQLESGGLRGEKERRVIRERRVTKVTKAQMEKRERKAMQEKTVCKEKRERKVIADRRVCRG